MPELKTPQHVRESYGSTVDGLNARWDLQLPRLHGRVAELAETEEPIARRCAGQIRDLCFQPQVNLDQLIEDFEDFAKQVKSDWKLKPSQERGTLLLLPKSTSALFHDVLSQPLRLTPEQRSDLLDHLDKLLHDECELVRSSESYVRSSSVSRATSIEQSTLGPPQNRAQQTARDRFLPAAVGEANSRKRDSKESSKRSSSSEGNECVRPPRKWQSIMDRLSSIKDFVSAERKFSEESPKIGPEVHEQKRKLNDDPSILSPPTRPPSVLGTTSFNSVTSVEPPKIFTPSSRQGSISSNDTSFQSVGTQLESQDYSLTQGDLETFQSMCDPGESMIETELVPHPKEALIAELVSDGPFRQPAVTMSPKTPLRFHYEVSRISQLTGINLDLLSSRLWRYHNDYQKFWKEAMSLEQRPSAILPQKASTEAWTYAQENFQHPKKKALVIMSGKLEWNRRDEAGLFHLILHPLKIEEGSRFFRTFGPDRFIVITIPALIASFLPQHLRKLQGTIHDGISSWLAKHVHYIVGRKWRAFYVEPVKPKRARNRTLGNTRENTDKDTTSDPAGFKVYLFAVDGKVLVKNGADSSASRHTPQDISAAMGVLNLLDWHIPIKANLMSTDCKAFQRFRLGLSKTIPSVVLEGLEIVRVPDIKNSSKDKVMNDGCARMSWSLGRQIAIELGIPPVPSVFQGRIAGAKGLWMVDRDEVMGQLYEDAMQRRKFCIEITDSQLKIEPRSEDLGAMHEAQRTFDVVDYSVFPRSASLSPQIINILHEQGISKETLRNLLLAGNNLFDETLCSAIHDRIGLRGWINQNKSRPRVQEEIAYIGAFPDDPEEQAIRLLESGFMPNECPFLRSKLRLILKQHLDRYVDKFQIRVPCSTYLFCIADPYGVLDENEVHVGFSQAWKSEDAETGEFHTDLDGIDVLVSRTPAYLPSDIQRRRAVFKKELRHFKDVVVFSTKGHTPLADLLSGGDYDGDTPLLCWDQRIVNPFRNAPLPSNQLSATGCGITNCARRLSTIFKNKDGPTPEETDDFFEACFQFNLQPSGLGLCATEHEKVSYEEGLASPQSIELATLAGYLVDGSKQGYRLSGAAWEEFRKRVSPHERSRPAYRSEEIERRKAKNILDYLKFWVAATERDKTLEKFHTLFADEDDRKNDPDLTFLWVDMRKLQYPRLQSVLSQLEKDIAGIRDEWARYSLWQEDGGKNRRFQGQVRQSYERFRMIQPIDEEHELAKYWQVIAGRDVGPWSLLRASCLYTKSHPSTISWYLAGEDLCQIKVLNSGPSRAIVNDLYNAYNLDKKFVRRVVGVRDEDNEDA